MYRDKTCGELRISDCGKTVTLAGWVQKVRNLGGMIFIDLRDRYGITQIIVNDSASEQLKNIASSIGREFVLQVKGTVAERSSKNNRIPTGDIEIEASEIVILSESETPPFTIEEESNGGDELRMKYRYLDLRRPPLLKNLKLRHRVAQIVRNYLDGNEFMEIETPYLIKSTPEGARDFIVPSRMNPGQFYALPQSPQTLKQILMVAGYDRYFQIVRCFRDEDLRADRQPEFTQIDCEMSFVERADIISVFEGLIKKIFKEVLGIEFSEPFRHMQYDDAMRLYGSDKPDLRFGMEIHEFGKELTAGDFALFNEAEYVGALCAEGAATYTRKQIDELTEWVRRPQIGAKGLIYARVGEDGTVKSSVDKFFPQEKLQLWKNELGAKAGDLILVMAGKRNTTRVQLGTLRIEMAHRLDLIKKGDFAPLWVVDFPLVEWDEEEQRFFAMHHPFTSPSKKDMDKFFSNPGEVHADAYDFVCNGTEVGGGSIRIHDRKIQDRMFEVLGFTKEEAEAQFGFLLGAFKYGAPPHGGIAFGFDRLCALLAGEDSIRDFIAFPKNTAGRDTMLDAPAEVADKQLKELSLKTDLQ